MPLRSRDTVDLGGASRASTVFGVMEEGLISSGVRNPRVPKATQANDGNVISSKTSGRRLLEITQEDKDLTRSTEVNNVPLCGVVKSG